MLHIDVFLFAVTWRNATFFEKEMHLALYSDMSCTSTLAQGPVMLYRFSSSQVSFWSDALIGTCCAMAPIQGEWTFDQACAANTSEKSVRMRDHHPLSPIFSLIFINVITQHWHQLFMSIAHSWPDLKFKAMLNFKLWYSDLFSAKSWTSKFAHMVLL